jgi:hypothetical protein
MNEPSTKEMAMKCTAFALSLVMFSTACRADAPVAAPVPTTPPIAATAPAAPTGPPDAPNRWMQNRPGASAGVPRGGYVGGRSGSLSIDGAPVDGAEGWTIVKRASAGRPTEKGSYLGISGTAVPTVLRDQLKLQRGVGLVVNFVEAGSPAEAAGVKPSDVLQNFDEQILINTQQFAVLVRNSPVDAPIRFTLIREAKPMELSVKPVERDLPALSDASSPASMLSPITDYNAALKYMKAAQSDAFSAQNEALNLQNEALKSLKAFGLESDDGQHSLSISQSDGHRRLTAKDKSGKMIYEGPIDTPEQMDKLPEEIREKVRKISARPFPTSQPYQRSYPMKLAPAPALPSVPLLSPRRPGERVEPPV